MTRTLVAACVLAACSAVAPHDRPATFADLALGEQVPRALLVAAAADMEDCIGWPPDIDGWTAYVVDDGTQCWTGACFRCPADTHQTCSAELPPGCEREEDCPCECSGLTNPETKRIALAPGLASLRHEVKHGPFGVLDHDNEGCWACVSEKE